MTNGIHFTSPPWKAILSVLPALTTRARNLDSVFQSSASRLSLQTIPQHWLCVCLLQRPYPAQTRKSKTFLSKEPTTLASHLEQTKP